MAETKTTTKTAAPKKTASKASATKTSTSSTKTTAAKTTTAKATTAKKTTSTKAVAAKVEAPKAVEVKAEVAPVEVKALAPAKKEIAGPKLQIKLVKSKSGRLGKQIKTLTALGLNKINQTVIKPDNAATRGMIFVVKHLVEVTEIK